MAITLVSLAVKPTAKGPISVLEVLKLLECLKQVVGEKVNRFESFLSGHTSVDPETVFSEITQPDRQLATIVAAVYSYFVGILSKEESMVKIRVALARMGERHIAGWECFYPSHTRPRSSIEALQTPCAGFSRAKAAGRMIVIESVKREGLKRATKRRFEITDQNLEDGSMICYPVRVAGHEIPFVLSICANKAGHFRADQQDVYRCILENFEQRIALEFCLQSIKRKMLTEKTNHETEPRSCSSLDVPEANGASPSRDSTTARSS